MHYWHGLDVGPQPPSVLNAVVEIPKGSRNKYEIDKAGGFIKLDRVLYSSLVYPGDYGIIPRTLYDDGDPLDHLTIVTEPTFPGWAWQSAAAWQPPWAEASKPASCKAASPLP